jgi:hypothetical protein
MNTNIQKLDIAIDFQPSDETLTAVKSYLDTLEKNNHPVYHTQNFRGTTLVEMKDISKSDFFFWLNKKYSTVLSNYENGWWLISS